MSDVASASAAQRRQPRLRLNYILNHYSPAAATHFAHVAALLREMKNQGCDINLFVEKAPSGAPVLQGVRVHVLRLRLPVLRHLELFLRLSIAICRGYQTTFVRISAPSAVVASLCHFTFGGKAFLWQSGATHAFDSEQPFTRRKLTWYLLSAFPNYVARSVCQRFVTGPESMISYYVDVVGVRHDKIRLLYNDIDLQTWGGKAGRDRGETFEERFGVPRPTHVLLLVHRLSPVRRTPMYLAPVFKRLVESFRHDWILLIAGSGSEVPIVRRLAREAQVESCCRFLGAVPNMELPALYQLADVFVNPSHAEGFPRVILEAMASGLPILTTDAGGTKDLLGPRQAVWVTDRDAPDEFARRLVHLLSDAYEMRSISEENRAVVSRFSTPEVARMYLSTLAE